jgi:hypothetical protein
MTRQEHSIPGLSIAYNIFAIPYNFLLGFIVGLAAPVAAIAAMLAGVRFLTGRMPFLSLGPETDADERQLSFELVPAEDARGRFDEEKQRILDDLDGLRKEIKSLVEEAEASREAEEEG